MTHARGWWGMFCWNGLSEAQQRPSRSCESAGSSKSRSRGPTKTFSVRTRMVELSLEEHVSDETIGDEQDREFESAHDVS